MSSHLCFAQSTLDELKKFGKKDDRNAEFIFELAEVFKHVREQKGYDLTDRDTLYIARGSSIRSHTSHGRIWNNKLKVFYRSKPIEENGKERLEVILSDHYYEDKLYKFDKILDAIENYDENVVEQYAKDRDVFNAIYWTIFTLEEKKNGKHKVQFYTINDFFVPKEDPDSLKLEEPPKH